MSAALSDWELGDELWFEIDRDVTDLVPPVADAFLAALLVPAMAVGEDVVVEGEVSERLVANLGHPLQILLQIARPHLRRVQIRAERAAVPPPPDAMGVLTGFSGGVDSFTTLAEYHFWKEEPSLRVTHLCFNNVGAHGIGERGDRLFRARYEPVRRAAEEIGLPIFSVHSNLAAIYHPVEPDFTRTVSWRNTAVALLFQRGIAHFLHSSSNSWGEVMLQAGRGSGRSEPMVLPLMGTERLNVLAVGSEYNRVRKTQRIAELPASWDHLHVCTSQDSPPNCSSCTKCVQTMVTLDVAGRLDRYAGSFDLARYRRNRAFYIGRTLHSDHVFDREIRAFIAERGWTPPLGARLRAIRDWASDRVTGLVPG